MAVTVPPELNWLLDILAGQSWPQGDEDALRQCSQAWMDAMLAIGNLADSSDVTAQSVMLNADSTSSDQFQAFWNTYLSKTNPGFGQSLNQQIDPGNGVHTTFGDLFEQCEQLAGNLVDQANEVEYTKLVIVITVIITAIMIAMAVAEAVETLGASLVEVGLAVFIGREAVVMAISRFIQMALMMLVPDLIAQGVLVAQGKGWDWSKTWSAGENALVGGLIGAFLGAGVGKLGWMGSGGSRFLQLATHAVEGGLVNDATAVTTLGGQFIWADLHGDKNTMAEVEQQLSFSNLAHQFLQGGLLSTIFYLPHMAVPHGTAVTFTTTDGEATFRTIISDKTTAPGWRPGDLETGQLPSGVKLPVFDDKGIRFGTVTFDGDQATVSSMIGGKTVTVNLSSQGYSVARHDGSLNTYHLVDQNPRAELLTQVRPSGEDLRIQTPNGPVDVPKGSTVHYTADGQVYRADIVQGNEVTTWQTATPGEPLEVTGVTVHSTVPLLSGVFGVKASTTYGADGTRGEPLATVEWFAGKLHVSDANRASYRDAVYDNYSPLASNVPAKIAGIDGVASVSAQQTAALAGTGPFVSHESEPRGEQQYLALSGVPTPPDFALKDVLGTPRVPVEPEREVEFEDGTFTFKNVPPATPAPDGGADAGSADLERSQRLDAVRQHFLADHRSAAGEAAPVSGGLPAWLDGEPGKILLVTTFWKTDQGGIPVFNRELAKALAAAGHEVYVAVLDEDLPQRVQKIDGVTLFTHIADLPAQVDAVIGHTRFTGQQAQELRANFYPDALLAHFQHMVPGGLGEVKAGEIIYRAPRVSDYQDVVIEEVNGTVTARFVERDFSGDTGIARLDDLYQPDGEQAIMQDRPETVGAAFFRELRKAARNEELERELVRKADLGIGVGPAIAADTRMLVGDGRVPIVREVIPGLDFTRVITPPPLDDHGKPVDGQYNVLLIGRADEAQKGALEAAEMVRKLTGPDLNVHLIIRGFALDKPDEMERMAARLTEKAGVPVEVRPFTTDPDELTADLSEAHLVIAPGSGEGFGMSAAGAAAVGVPVLVPKSSGYGMFLDQRREIPDTIRDTLVDQGFADQIPVDRWTGKIGAMLADLPTARKNAAELASLLKSPEQDRTWRGTADSMLDAMRELYRSRAGHLALGVSTDSRRSGSHVIDALRVEIIGEDGAVAGPESVRFAHVSVLERQGDHVVIEVREGEAVAVARIDVDQATRHMVISADGETGRELRDRATAAETPYGTFDVFGHADQHGMVVGGMHVRFTDLTPYLPELPVGTVIRMCGCEAGAGDGLARLADLTGHSVKGSTDIVWLDRRGNVFAGHKAEGGELRPHLTDDGYAEGSWRTFKPGGVVTDAITVRTLLTHVTGPGDVMTLAAGDVFDRATMFGPRSARELRLPDEVQDFAGHSGYLSPPPSSAPVGELPYRPADEIVVNVELQHLAENAIGVGYIRATRDLQGDAGKDGYIRVLDDGDRSRAAGEQAAERIRQQRQDAGKPPPGRSTLARHVRHADERFRPLRRLTDEAASMHDDVYLLNGGKARGETDPVSVHGIPVNINYSAQFNTTDTEPKPGYLVVDFPKNGSYPDLLTALEPRRQNYAGPASEFDERYANAMLNLVRDQPKILSDSFADLPEGLRDTHVAELYKLAKDCFSPADYDKFSAAFQRDRIDSFGQTEVGRFIKNCAGLAVLNIGVEGARCPETFFTSLMTWNLVAEGRVSLPDALGYFNVMGADHAGLIAAHAEWTRYTWMDGQDPKLGPPGPKGTTIDLANEPQPGKPPSPDGWVVDKPGPYSNGIPSVRTSIQAGVEEFQRREREIVGLYADSRKLLTDLNSAFFGPRRSVAAQRQQLRLLVDELLIADMGWPPADVLFANV